MSVFVNTVVFDFGLPKPELKMLSVHQWIRSLGITLEQIYGLMPVTLASTQMVRLKFNKQADYEAFLCKFEGSQKLIVSDDQTVNVTVKAEGTRERYVRICDVPFEVSLDEVKKRLNQYGKVSSIRRETYASRQPEDGYFPTLSGWITARMEISKNIPSYMMFGGERAMIKYQGQIPTCMLCSATGHFGHKCPNKGAKSNHETWKQPGKRAESKKGAQEKNPKQGSPTDGAEKSKTYAAVTAGDKGNTSATQTTDPGDSSMETATDADQEAAAVDPEGAPIQLLQPVNESMAILPETPATKIVNLSSEAVEESKAASSDDIWYLLAGNKKVRISPPSSEVPHEANIEDEAAINVDKDDVALPFDTLDESVDFSISFPGTPVAQTAAEDQRERFRKTDLKMMCGRGRSTATEKPYQAPSNKNSQ